MKLGGGGWKPLYFYKVITPKAFDLEKVSYDHQQVGQAEKNGDAPKEAFLNLEQQCFKRLYFKRPKKTILSLIGRREEFFFYFKQKFLFLLLSFLWNTLNFNSTNKHKNYLQEK